MAMPVDANNVLKHLEALRTLTGDEHGGQRVAWTETWLRARAWFDSLVSGLPHQDRLERHYDAAGNHWVTLRGDEERALILGSHLDSVPNGGWLDGCLGVLGGFEVFRALNETYAGRPPITVRLVDWADEEGARFGRSLFGSSAFAGTHSIEADRGPHGQERHHARRGTGAMWCCGRPYRRRHARTRPRRRLPRAAHRAGAGA